jgi:hypothetical protein
MKRVDERPEGAKFRAVRWEDPAEVERWLGALQDSVAEVQAAARDRVRKKRGRVLSRAEARRKVRAAGRAIARLFEAAKASLRPSDPFDPVPSPNALEAGEAGESPSSARRPVAPPKGGEGA